MLRELHLLVLNLALQDTCDDPMILLYFSIRLTYVLIRTRCIAIPIISTRDTAFKFKLLPLLPLLPFHLLLAIPPRAFLLLCLLGHLCLASVFRPQRETAAKKDPTFLGGSLRS